MTTTTIDEARQAPLITDEDIRRRVAELIGRANIRQLWLLFLDSENVQLPMLIPIDGLPAEPTEEQTARVVTNIAELMGDIGLIDCDGLGALRRSKTDRPGRRLGSLVAPDLPSAGHHSSGNVALAPHRSQLDRGSRLRTRLNYLSSLIIRAV
jgi:hypothetical protein